MLFRIFFRNPQVQVSLQGDDFHYLSNVLSLRQKDNFEIIDGSGFVYVYQIIGLDKNKITAQQITKNQEEKLPKVQLTIVLPLLKNEKQELILQKTTELGVSHLIIYQADKSKNKLNQVEKKMERWQKIIAGAVCQSRQSILPSLATVDDLLKISLTEAFYFADTLETKNFLSQINTSQVAIVFGPESGFSERERNFLLTRATPLSLGQNILRTETAPIAVVAKLLLP